jgi:transcriptional regulator with GAF, ATPase, and Fis domain
LTDELKTVGHFEEIVGDSEALRNVLGQVELVAGADSTVLIQGETGAGKELIARAVHNRSPRREKPFIKLNCAALPRELIESELFGHEKGAFTGAIQQRKGRFELADQGTLFLDEVGELPLEAQAKLLRVLQEQEFERIGGTRTIRVDVRVVAATNRNLERLVEANQFRIDLFYRLNVFPLTMPPLRERPSDIPPLAEFFLARLAPRLGKPFSGISENALRRLQGYSWPGNVRELQNVIERAAILSTGPTLDIDFLEAPPAPAPRAAPPDTLEHVERAHILRVLGDTDGVIDGPRGAAAILGLNPSTLRSRLRKLGIKKPCPAIR